MATRFAQDEYRLVVPLSIYLRDKCPHDERNGVD